MKLINLTNKQLHPAEVNSIIIDVPDEMSITVRDAMYRVMDGEWEPCSIQQYLETTHPSREHRNIVLPFIKDDKLMREIATSFDNHKYRIWTTKDNLLEVVLTH